MPGPQEAGTWKGVCPTVPQGLHWGHGPLCRHSEAVSMGAVKGLVFSLRCSGRTGAAFFLPAAPSASPIVPWVTAVGSVVLGALGAARPAQARPWGIQWGLSREPAEAQGWSFPLHAASWQQRICSWPVAVSSRVPTRWILQSVFCLVSVFPS